MMTDEQALKDAVVEAAMEALDFDLNCDVHVPWAEPVRKTINAAQALRSFRTPKAEQAADDEDSTQWECPNCGRFEYKYAVNVDTGERINFAAECGNCGTELGDGPKAEPEVALLPCPFCGGEAELLSAAIRMDGACIIQCTDCGADVEESSDYGGIAKWNARVSVAKPITEAEADPHTHKLDVFSRDHERGGFMVLCKCGARGRSTVMPDHNNITWAEKAECATPEAEVTKVEASEPTDRDLDDWAFTCRACGDLTPDQTLTIARDLISFLRLRQFSLPKASTPRLTDAEIVEMAMSTSNCARVHQKGAPGTQYHFLDEPYLCKFARSIESKARGEK